MDRGAWGVTVHRVSKTEATWHSAAQNTAFLEVSNRDRSLGFTPSCFER